MNSQTPSSTPITVISNNPAANPAKCTHFTTSGRRCRLRALRSGLCFRHLTLQISSSQPVDTDLSADLLIQLEDLQSADQINQFLGRLLMVVVQNRISPRRAAVLAYITNQLLRTLSAIATQENAEPTQIIFDMPGPDRDNPSPTSPQADPNPCKPH